MSEDAPREATPAPTRTPSPLRKVLLTALIPLSVGAICFTSVALWVVSSAKGHPAYEAALAAVRADPEVRAAIGSPVEPGFLVQGGEHSDDGFFEAMFSVTGPTGDAGVRVLAKPAPGPPGSPGTPAWELVFLDVGAKLDNGRDKVITLVDEELPRRFGVQRDALAPDGSTP